MFIRLIMFSVFVIVFVWCFSLVMVFFDSEYGGSEYVELFE